MIDRKDLDLIGLDPRDGMNFINGQFRPALSGLTDEVVAPATGAVIA